MPADCVARPRGGFTIAELLVASALLGTLFAVSIPLLSHVRMVQLDCERRTQAQQALANLMEQVSALALAGRLAELPASSLSIPQEVGRQLPEHVLDVDLQSAADSNGTRRVTMKLSWLDDAGRRGTPVELTAWFPGREGAQ